MDGNIHENDLEAWKRAVNELSDRHAFEAEPDAPIFGWLAIVGLLMVLNALFGSK